MASPLGRPPLKVADCPQVALLIDYAWNRASGDECRQIEAHLQNGHCRHCQAWIDRARQQAPPPLASQSSNPIDSQQWHRQAFSDLENRLRQLDEQT